MRTPISEIKRCPLNKYCGTCMFERRDKEDNSFCTIYTGKEPETQERSRTFGNEKTDR